MRSCVVSIDVIRPATRSEADSTCWWSRRCCRRRCRAGEIGLAQDLTDEVVAEAESEPVDAQDPAFAEPLELLRERGRVGVEELCERLGVERLLEHGRGGEDPVRLAGPRCSALCEQRLRQRPRRTRRPAVRDGVGDCMRMSAGRLVEVGHAQRGELRRRERLEPHDRVRRQPPEVVLARGCRRQRGRHDAQRRRRTPRRRRYAIAASVLGSAQWRSSSTRTTGPCSATRATSASSTSISSNSPHRCLGCELGKDLPERRPPVDVGPELGERLTHARRRSARRAGAARAPSSLRARLRTPSRRRSSSSSRRDLPRPASPSTWMRTASSSPRRIPSVSSSSSDSRPSSRTVASPISASRPPDPAREQRVDVLLAEDGRLERSGLPARLEPELVVQPHSKLAVAARAPRVSGRVRRARASRCGRRAR